MSKQFMAITDDPDCVTIVGEDASCCSDADIFIAGDEATAITFAMEHLNEFEDEKSLVIYELVPVKRVKRANHVVENYKNVKKGNK